MNNLFNQFILKKMNFDNINNSKLFIGSFIELNYKILEKQKEIKQKYSGYIISIHNTKLSKSFRLLYKINNNYVEYSFPVNSPHILNIEIKGQLCYKKSKLYFLKYIKNIKKNAPDWT